MVTVYGKEVVSPDWAVNETSEISFNRVYFVTGGTTTYTSSSVSFKLLPNHVYIFPTHHAYRMHTL